MKVEILNEFKHDTATYYPGEVVIERDDICQFWCNAGWAKDVTGTYPTTAPSTETVVLFVEDITSATSVPTLEV